MVAELTTASKMTDEEKKGLIQALKERPSLWNTSLAVDKSAITSKAKHFLFLTLPQFMVFLFLRQFMLFIMPVFRAVYVTVASERSCKKRFPV